MLEEFKKKILRGSLSSHIIIINLNFSSISYKKCRRLAKGIWLFVGGWKLVSNFFLLECEAVFVTCTAMLQFLLEGGNLFYCLSLIRNSQITKQSDYCIFPFFPSFLFIFPFPFLFSDQFCFVYYYFLFLFFPYEKRNYVKYSRGIPFPSTQNRVHGIF